MIGGESSPDVGRDEIEPWMPADHGGCAHMGRQARRHPCISLVMLESVQGVVVYFHVRFQCLGERRPKHQAATKLYSQLRERELGNT